MFGYLFKNLPTEFLYGGHLVKKGISSTTATVDGKTIYDAYLYSYMEENLSLFIKMEDGSFKCINENVNIKEINSEELISKHLERAEFVDIADYGEYDKNKPYGVFISNNLETIIKEEMTLETEENQASAARQAIIGVKKSLSGMEALGYINRFNRRNKLENKVVCLPPIKKDAEDTIDSLLGDMEEYKKLIEGKSNDQIVKLLIEKANELDSVGNKIYESLGL